MVPRLSVLSVNRHDDCPCSGGRTTGNLPLVSDSTRNNQQTHQVREHGAGALRQVLPGTPAPSLPLSWAQLDGHSPTGPPSLHIPSPPAHSISLLNLTALMTVLVGPLTCLRPVFSSTSSPRAHKLSEGTEQRLRLWSGAGLGGPAPTPAGDLAT